MYSVPAKLPYLGDEPQLLAACFDGSDVFYSSFHLITLFHPLLSTQKRDETNAQRDGCMDRKMLRDKINTPSSSKKKTQDSLPCSIIGQDFHLGIGIGIGRSRSLSLSQLVHCHRLLSLIKEKGVSFVKKINLEDKTPQRLGMKKMEKNIFLSLVHLKKRNL